MNNSESNVSVSPPASSAFSYPTISSGTLSIIFVCTGITGLLTNVFVVVVVATSRQLRQQPRNWFIFNQSVADLASAFFIITSITKSATQPLQGPGGFLVCWLWLTYVPINTTTIASEYMLVAFTLEVYLAIVWPVKHQHVFIRRPTVVISVTVIWIFSAIYSMSISAAVARVVNGLCNIGYYWLTAGRGVSVSMVLIKNVLPISVYVLCYARIMRSLRRRVAPGSSQQHMHVHFTRARTNVAKTLLVTLIVHVVAWSGSQVQILTSAFGYPLDSTSVVYQLMRLATYISGCVNPIIYLIKYNRFRRAVRRLACPYRERHKEALQVIGLQSLGGRY